MKQFILTLALVLLAPVAFACDETCLRDKAMAQHNVSFPSYLDSKYCKTTSVDFLVGARKSLQKYFDERLNSAHRGGARNIRSFIEQRKEWLQECDNYLSLTGQGRIFRTKETTDEIFAVMTVLCDDLQSLVKLPRTANEDGYELAGNARQSFERMFTLVDAHRTDLQLRGQL